MRNPGARAGTHDGLQRRDQPAGRLLYFDTLATALVCIRLAVGDHDHVFSAQFAMKYGAQSVGRPGQLALVARARLVVAAVEVSTPVVTRADLERCAQDVLFVDLGIPRAVASDLHGLANVRRLDIGDLRERVEQALDDRHEAVDAARDIVGEDVERFLADQRARGASAIVRDLREYFDEVVAGEMARRERDVEDLTSEQRDRVASLLRSVVAKIAHRPTVALKEAAGTDQGTRLSEATRTLFDL